MVNNLLVSFGLYNAQLRSGGGEGILDFSKIFHSSCIIGIKKVWTQI